MTELVYDFEAGFDDPHGKNAWFERTIGSGRRVLEVGCATGYVGEYLVNVLHNRVVGVEIVPEAAEKARGRGCYESVIEGDILDPSVAARLGDEPFDFVVFGDVLEHLSDPEAALRVVAGRLAAGGRILICVPNVVHWSIRMRMLAGRFDYTTTGILDRTHLRFFTPTTAADMVRSAGLDIVWSGGVVWLPSPTSRLGTSTQERMRRAAERISPGFFYGQVLLEAAPSPDVPAPAAS